MSLINYKNQWFSNIRGDFLAGVVVALALVPEAIAFSLIAGVDPKVGLYASAAIAGVTAFVGGRPGMISAATGAMALVMVSLVKNHGLEYLLAATILCGIIQILAGFLRLGVLLRFVSRSVMVGFVNALAILIFLAQLPEIMGAGWLVYGLVGLGLLIIYGFPLINKSIPSPLVAIISLTALSIACGFDIRCVGDMGQLPDTLPQFLLPNIPLTLDTFKIILPYSLTLAAVGLLESLLTASIVDELTNDKSNKEQECFGQGIANIVAGFFGGMAGCAMIGQSVINIKSGGRGRLSTFIAALFLLIMIIFFGNYLAMIPMAALVSVMLMVSFSTFNWSSIKELKTHPLSSSITMIATVVTVVVTHDLAKGVLAGVILSAIFFARHMAEGIEVISERCEHDKIVTYKISGQLFFASQEKLMKAFDFLEQNKEIIIDLTKASVIDCTAVQSIEKIIKRFKNHNNTVHVIEANSHCKKVKGLLSSTAA